MRGENNACALNALRGNARQPVIRVLILYFNSNYEGLWNLKKKKKKGQWNGSATKQAKLIIHFYLNRYSETCIYIISE